MSIIHSHIINAEKKKGLLYISVYIISYECFSFRFLTPDPMIRLISVCLLQFKLVLLIYVRGVYDSTEAIWPVCDTSCVINAKKR